MIPKQCELLKGSNQIVCMYARIEYFIVIIENIVFPFYLDEIQLMKDVFLWRTHNLNLMLYIAENPDSTGCGEDVKLQPISSKSGINRNEGTCFQVYHINHVI